MESCLALSRTYPATCYQVAPVIDLSDLAGRERLSTGAVQVFFNIWHTGKFATMWRESYSAGRLMEHSMRFRKNGCQKANLLASPVRVCAEPDDSVWLVSVQLL